MGVENWSENVVLVSLPGEPQTVEELTDVAELISEREDCDVVVDCSQIDRIGRSSCRLLLELHGALTSRGHQLVLCGSRPGLREAFTSPALAHVLRFADDRFTALARLELALAQP
ncbi:MAG: STAS domain-containing protein [Phycisphaerae bacterium]|nr:STAS domain-containing protein [Phycisphaerae bacterium]